MDPTILFYVKNFINGRRLTSGDGLSSNIAPKQAVYAYIQDSEKKVFSDFGSNPFMTIGGDEPSAK